MAVETETQLEAFIASSTGASLKKIEVREASFKQFENYFAVYANKFKERTAFIDNVLVTHGNTTMQVLTKYDNERDSIEFEYSSMALGTLDNLSYAYALVRKTGVAFRMSYVSVYMNGAFADTETITLLNSEATISCDIYTIE